MPFSKEGGREEDENQFSSYVSISMLLKCNYIFWQQHPQDGAKFWSESQVGQFGLNQSFFTASHGILYRYHTFISFCWYHLWCPCCHNRVPKFHKRRFLVLGYKPASSPWLYNLKINTPAII